VQSKHILRPNQQPQDQHIDVTTTDQGKYLVWNSSV